MTARQIDLMENTENSQSLVPGHCRQQGHDFFCGFRIQTGHRFVSQNDGWLLGQGAGDRNTLRLSP